MGYKARDIVVYKGNTGSVVIDTDKRLRFLPTDYGNYYTDRLDYIDEKECRMANDEEVIDHFKREFVWGDVRKVHVYGDYIVFEYLSNTSKGTAYHTFTNREDDHHSYSYLEEAIIGAICRRYDGNNTQADRLIFKMLGISKDEG